MIRKKEEKKMVDAALFSLICHKVRVHCHQSMTRVTKSKIDLQVTSLG